MENELLNLLRDLVGDFPRNVKSNALESAREYLAQVESGSTPVAPDEGDSYDFTDPDQNPWLLSHQEADRVAALRR